MEALLSKINKLTLENKQLKHRSIITTLIFTWRKIKTDAKLKFYTEINAIVNNFLIKYSFAHIDAINAGYIKWSLAERFGVSPLQNTKNRKNLL